MWGLQNCQSTHLGPTDQRMLDQGDFGQNHLGNKKNEADEITLLDCLWKED